MGAEYKKNGADMELVGFENIDDRFTGKEAEKYRKTIDKDTPLYILPPKPIIIMP